MDIKKNENPRDNHQDTDKRNTENRRDINEDMDIKNKYSSSLRAVAADFGGLACL